MDRIYARTDRKHSTGHVVYDIDHVYPSDHDPGRGVAYESWVCVRAVEDIDVVFQVWGLDGVDKVRLETGPKGWGYEVRNALERRFSRVSVVCLGKLNADGSHDGKDYPLSVFWDLTAGKA